MTLRTHTPRWSVARLGRRLTWYWRLQPDGRMKVATLTRDEPEPTHLRIAISTVIGGKRFKLYLDEPYSGGCVATPTTLVLGGRTVVGRDLARGWGLASDYAPLQASDLNPRGKA